MTIAEHLAVELADYGADLTATDVLDVLATVGAVLVNNPELASDVYLASLDESYEINPLSENAESGDLQGDRFRKGDERIRTAVSGHRTDVAGSFRTLTGPMPAWLCPTFEIGHSATPVALATRSRRVVKRGRRIGSVSLRDLAASTRTEAA